MRCGTPPTESGDIGRGYGLGPGRTSSALRLHEGCDFIARRGDKVRASFGGTVELVASDDIRHGPLEGYGNAVVIRTVVPGLSGSTWWLYAHLESTPLVHVGQTVATGQGIGRVGNTTNGRYPGMGAHLHHVTSSRPWPKGYGIGSFDPVIAFAQIGVVFEPAGGRRGRFVQGPSCGYSFPSLGLWQGEWDGRTPLGALGIDPAASEEYEPPPEAFTEDYEVSDLTRVGPLLLGLGLFGVGVLLVGSAVAGKKESR